MSTRIINADCRDALREMPDESVHCVVTSPPYWGLRDYGVDGAIGLEATVDEHVAAIVGVFHEVRRVLRADGTVWLNYGDCYATGAGKVGDHPGGGAQGAKWAEVEARGHRGQHLAHQSGKASKRVAAMGPMTQPNRMPQPGLKPKDLVLLPARVALALQADGWWLRSDIIWHKPNPMPESVTDRPTSAHEHMFLLAKSARYSYDAEAVREPHADTEHTRSRYQYAPSAAPKHDDDLDSNREADTFARHWGKGGRNLRNVWTIATAPFPDAHFATFPPALVEPCIKAGTSERGVCPACGAPWVREVEHQDSGQAYERGACASDHRVIGQPQRTGSGSGALSITSGTIGWSPSCACNAQSIPATVLDPFGGAGTTGLVADRLGRDAILIEMNPDYADMARRRIASDAPLFSEVAAE